MYAWIVSGNVDWLDVHKNSQSSGRSGLLHSHGDITNNARLPGNAVDREGQHVVDTVGYSLAKG